MTFAPWGSAGSMQIYINTIKSPIGNVPSSLAHTVLVIYPNDLPSALASLPSQFPPSDPPLPALPPSPRSSTRLSTDLVPTPLQA